MSFPASITRPVGATDAAPTMSSREIAELVGTTHDSVLKTVRALVARGIVSGNETPYTHPQNGQRYSEFLLSYRDTMVVVSGYSVEVRARIIDRWQELEAQTAALPDLNDPAFLRSTLLTYTEKVIVLQAQVTTMAPKAEVFDRLEAAEGDLVPSEAAKAIKTSQTACFRLIEELSWAFRRGGRWIGKADAERVGFVRHKTSIYKVGTADHTRLQLVITPKGRNRLAQILNAGGPTGRSVASPTTDLFGGLQ